MERQSENLLYQLALWRTPEIGPSRFSTILRKFPQLSDFFALTSKDLSALGFKEKTVYFLKQQGLQQAEKDLNWQNGKDKQIICFASGDYPRFLKEIQSAPPLLFMQGNKQCLHDLQMGMVGTRHPSSMGIELADQFAQELAKRGFVINSGFAIGIDGACHRGALAAQGKTIAVMGTGLDMIYPRRHRNLAHKIIESGGAMVSEFPIGTPPKAENFPRRNRLISGLSQGVLVVEAALKSGSLITAQYALEQGREVFALPGSILQPLNKGCHQLIRQGAKLVETVDDILEELLILPILPLSTSLSTQAVDISTEKCKSQRKIVLSDVQESLVKCLTFAVMPIDKVIECSKLDAHRVIAALLELELAGVVSAVPGGYQLKQ